MVRLSFGRMLLSSLLYHLAFLIYGWQPIIIIINFWFSFYIAAISTDSSKQVESFFLPLLSISQLSHLDVCIFFSNQNKKSFRFDLGSLWVRRMAFAWEILWLMKKAKCKISIAIKHNPIPTTIWQKEMVKSAHLISNGTPNLQVWQGFRTIITYINSTQIDFLFLLKSIALFYSLYCC